MIVILGANGSVGGALVDAVRAAGLACRPASARSAPPAGGFAFDDEPAATMAGATRAFFYADAGRIRRALSAADCLRHVVLLSGSGADGPGDDPITTLHRDAEAELRRGDVSWTILRAGAFATNTLQWAGEVRRHESVSVALPEARLCPVHERDLADAAATILRAPSLEHAGATYEISGPELVSQRDQVAAIGEATGRAVSLNELSIEQYRAALSRWGDERMVETLIDRLRDAACDPDAPTDTLPALLGRPARTYAQWARDHAADFT